MARALPGKSSLASATYYDPFDDGDEEDNVPAAGEKRKSLRRNARGRHPPTSKRTCPTSSIRERRRSQQTPPSQRRGFAIGARVEAYNGGLVPRED